MFRLRYFGVGLALGAVLVIGGCDDSPSAGSTGEGATPTDADTVNTYEIVFDEPGTPLSEPLEPWIDMVNRMGFVTSFNVVDGLELTETAPRLVIRGTQTFKGSNFVRSRPLRIEHFLEPTGSRMVQVTVNLDGPLPLKELKAEERNIYVPAPVLIDNIGNVYWASGYILRDATSGERKHTINLDRGNQLKNLNDIPRLSINKPQELTLLFYVNQGVTITSFSYGGQQPKYTFNLEITDR